MTISETAVPAAGSHPYAVPPLASLMPEGDDWATIGQRFRKSYAECVPSFTEADEAEWKAEHWSPVPGRMYEGMRGPGGWITGTAPDPKPRRSHAVTADTRPDPVPAHYVPAPQPLPLPQPDTGPELTRRQRRFFGRTKHEPPLRDQPPAEVPAAWVQPEQPRGRHARSDGTAPHPAADSQEAPTILPGAIEPVPAEDDAAAAAVQQQSNEALRRAGAKPSDLADLARPGDGRDATSEMTAVTERPADPGEQR